MEIYTQFSIQIIAHVCSDTRPWIAFLNPHSVGSSSCTWIAFSEKSVLMANDSHPLINEMVQKYPKTVYGRVY